jgi:D-beta-D-heptose 7-phosphate kinase/D-beta-D-heptose 1-phosphate adenosyltransferase
MTIEIPDFDDINVLVVGDVMLDRYWFGDARRVSPEAPVPVVHVTDTDNRPGGAANVAMNLVHLGVNTRLIGATGGDEAGRILAGRLRASKVDSDLYVAQDAATVSKLRVVSRNQQLIRLDFENPAPLASADAIEEKTLAALPWARLVVLSDYAKGGLAGVDRLIGACRDRALPVCVDPKGADFGRYAGATVLTPNENEFARVVAGFESETELETKAARLRRELQVGALVITRGERGISIIESGGRAQHLPARVREVFDVTGAGDTVIATLAAGLAAGMTVETAAELANIAAGLVVRKLGVAGVTRGELRLALHRSGSGELAGLERSELAAFVRESQQRGERVVMTNGCFDILHAGHIAFLQEARALGDRLLVAVNDDDSVRRLKGEGRPVMPLRDRIALLSGLAAVDWVVQFPEDTPEALIGEISPDVLVKGGDYRVEDIVGADHVRRTGGEVRVLSFLEGHSTSRIIESIRER